MKKPWYNESIHYSLLLAILTFSVLWLFTVNFKLKTVVIVDDQETIVLGGILRDIVTRKTQKVPVLGSIPLFGLLFRNKQDITEKQNLMLFLKPTIIRTGDDASSVTLDKYSTLKAIHGRQHESPLLNQMPPNVEELFDASAPAPVADPK